MGWRVWVAGCWALLIERELGRRQGGPQLQPASKLSGPDWLLRCSAPSEVIGLLCSERRDSYPLGPAQPCPPLSCSPAPPGGDWHRAKVLAGSIAAGLPAFLGKLNLQHAAAGAAVVVGLARGLLRLLVAHPKAATRWLSDGG